MIYSYAISLILKIGKY